LDGAANPLLNEHQFLMTPLKSLRISQLVVISLTLTLQPPASCRPKRGSIPTLVLWKVIVGL